MMQPIQKIVQMLKQNIGRVVVGRDEAIELMLCALICRGHVLIEDVPGVGKTTLAHVIARTTKASFIEFSAVTSGIREIRYLSDKYADTPSTLASKRMLSAAGVKCIQLRTGIKSITLDFTPEEEK